MCQLFPQHNVEPNRPTNLPVPERILAKVPSHAACAEALTTAQSLLPASIFNHSLRVYLYALQTQVPPPTASSVVAPQYEREVLFVSCILHDIGASSTLALDPLRFEKAGADFAASLLARHGFSAPVVREAWLAVAMHSSPHIAEGAGGLVSVMRLAVLADFRPVAHHSIPVISKECAVEVEEQLPRLNVEKELGDTVVAQTRAVRSKAPGGSWPGDLLRAAEEEPEWEGVNKGF